MKIHKAGFSVIIVAILLFVAILTVLKITVSASAFYVAVFVFICLLVFIFRFFRLPNRTIQFADNQVVAPADGTIVVIEEVDETEFLKEKCIQISIFMSVWNVHINWVPVIGKVIQVLHFNGAFIKARLPKSSNQNERSVTVIETGQGKKIVVKQIAGAVARRIITYAKPDQVSKPGDQLGFIRFGSRVDVLLPVGSKVHVNLNQKVTGGLTLLANLPDK